MSDRQAAPARGDLGARRAGICPAPFEPTPVPVQPAAAGEGRDKPPPPVLKPGTEKTMAVESPVNFNPPVVAVKAAPGHEDDEALMANLRTDVPALGWPTRLYVEGTKLMADLEKVPDVMRRLIQQGAYRKVS